MEQWTHHASKDESRRRMDIPSVFPRHRSKLGCTAILCTQFDACTLASHLSKAKASPRSSSPCGPPQFIDTRLLLVQRHREFLLSWEKKLPRAHQEASFASSPAARRASLPPHASIRLLARSFDVSGSVSLRHASIARVWWRSEPHVSVHRTFNETTWIRIHEART